MKWYTCISACILTFDIGQDLYDGTGSSCGVIDPGAEMNSGEWTAANCVTRKNSICQKLVGNACPNGWTYLQAGGKGKCYKFMLNGHDHVPWYSVQSLRYC